MLSSRTLVLILGVAFIILDQWVKLIALVALNNHSYVFGNQNVWLDLALSLNPGAFLSLGAGLAPGLKQLIFVVAVGIVCCWAIAWAYKHWQTAPIKASAAWFIAMGGLSNLIDRVFRDGHVVDYLVLNVGSLHTGVFNLADIAIMAGAAVLMVDGLTRPAKR
ncbi:signal peptidase II [Pseudomonas entomophila]|uniref:Lipoprotein signal peptidase n=2 Tax=Pseudomonas entomophila TaxID=312306 RepID=Q1IAZ4_PSEE4|nr:signal peptidase II [Pseudomonas entomophila]WMW04052.1 signal peptidase II [Pseudomonas entomophila]CAK15172.1 putative prolipoprotein signal peptidase (Signal peptidase II.) [Pseudomonas entomophila L48]